MLEVLKKQLKDYFKMYPHVEAFSFYADDDKNIIDISITLSSKKCTTSIEKD